MDLFSTASPSSWNAIEPLDGLFFRMLQQEIHKTTLEDAPGLDSLDSLGDAPPHPEAMLPLVWGIRYGLEHNIPVR